MTRSHSFLLDEIAIDRDGNDYLVTGCQIGIRVGDTIALPTQKFVVIEIDYYADQEYFIAKVSGATT